jgi:hypothetical protein
VIRAVRWMLASVCTAGGLFALAHVSAAPSLRDGAGKARLRLSWSARPERIEVCRALSANELAEREEHMRQRVECDGRFASYALRVDADSATLHDAVVRGGGLRHDRALFVLEDIDVVPGLHRIRVTFVRRETRGNRANELEGGASQNADTGIFAGRAGREMIERTRRARAAIPSRLALDTVVRFEPDRVILISLDPESRALRRTGLP